VKTLVKNKLGNKTVSMYLPCGTTEAETFCTNFLDGEYIGLEQMGVSGSDVATPYNQVNIMLKSDAGLKTYLNLAVKSAKSEDEIYTALKGKTYNGVKADNMAIISMRAIA
jgi:hypothetical protein